MSYIVPKLNLNRLPKNCEDYSLTCAKNIKILDNTIVNFDGIEEAIPNTLYITKKNRRRQTIRIVTLNSIGCIPYIDTFYILYKAVEVGREAGDEELLLDSLVIVDLKKYKEANVENGYITLGTYAYATAYKCFNGATIEGNVITNSKGDVIIELHQYNKNQSLNVPISFINLSEHTFTDIAEPYNAFDASFYTQAPDVPIVNFIFKDYADVSINSGVYSLFIRFKTAHDSYSNWMSCSKPFFIGNHRKTDTQVGSFCYMDSVLLASDYAITFDIYSAYIPDYYKGKSITAEIGYICKTEEEEYAGKLKAISITLDNDNPYAFTFIPSHSTDERININDLLEPIYNLYDVKNVTYKDNTFFASNYKESNINISLFFNSRVELASKLLDGIIGVPKVSHDNLNVLAVLQTSYNKGISSVNFSNEDSSNVLTINIAKQEEWKSGKIEDANEIVYALPGVCKDTGDCFAIYFGTETEAEAVINKGYETFTSGWLRHPQFDKGRFNGHGDKVRDHNLSEFKDIVQRNKSLIWNTKQGNTIKTFSASYIAIVKDNVESINPTGPNNSTSIDTLKSNVNNALQITSDDIIDAINSDRTELNIEDIDLKPLNGVFTKVIISYKDTNNVSITKERLFRNRKDNIGIFNSFLVKDDTSGVANIVLKADDFGKSAEHLTDVVLDELKVKYIVSNYTYYYNNEYYNLDDSNSGRNDGYFNGAIGSYDGPIGFKQVSVDKADYYYFADNNNEDYLGVDYWKDCYNPITKYNNGTHVRPDHTREGKPAELANALGFEEGVMSWVDIRKRRIKLYVGFDISEIAFSATYEQKDVDAPILPSIKLDNYSTLIPGQTYDFYVHFITNLGEITNGIKVDTLTVPYDTTTPIDQAVVYYPKFTIDTQDIPSNYVSYFYSFAKTNTYTASGVRYNETTLFDVLEMDLFMFNRYKEYDITIDGVDGREGKYLTSSDINNIDTFGSSGKFNYENAQDDRLYVSCEKHYDTQVLYRCTPYIERGVSVFDCADGIVSSVMDIFLDGYLCLIYKPLNDVSEFVWIDATCYKKIPNVNVPTMLGELDDIYDDEGAIIDYTIDSQTGTQKGNPILILDGGKFDVSYKNSGDVTFNHITDPEDVSKILNSTSIIGTGADAPTYFELQGIDTEQFNTSSDLAIIYSNYNLNFLRLREDLIENPKSIKIKIPYDIKLSTSGNYEVSYHTYYKTIYIYKISGTTLDSAYKTIPFYRDFTQLTYVPYNEKYSTYIYNTTIRKTERLGDSIEWNIPRFKSTYFYNLDANKGKIVNLLASGKSIIIHTEKGMFAFETNSKLVSNNGEINVENTEVFDIDPVDIVGSENGYAGLQEKHHATACFDGYVFADVSSNDLFVYNSGGLVNITENIKHLLEFFTIVDFAAVGIQKYGICLCCITLASKVDEEFTAIINVSYNFAKNAFISLHDFKFNKGYSNSINTIFEHGVIEEDNIVDYTTMNFSKPFTTVPNVAKISQDNIIYPTIVTTYDNVEYNNSYIDIIVVNNFELVKVLEFVNWCLTIPEDFVADATVDEGSNTADVYYNCDLYHMKGDIDPASSETDPYNKENAKSILIYSDSAVTNEILLDSSSNNKALDAAANYEKVRYNAGVWSLNYFRNIKSKDEQEKTLIYGKYFIVRFVFNPKRFKFESLTLKLNKYV